MLNRFPRVLIGSTGVLFVLFGLGCLNYTKVRGLAHHTEFAERHSLPKPSERILLTGAISLLVGAGTIGYEIGSRRRGS